MLCRGLSSTVRWSLVVLSRDKAAPAKRGKAIRPTVRQPTTTITFTDPWNNSAQCGEREKDKVGNLQWTTSSTKLNSSNSMT